MVPSLADIRATVGPGMLNRRGFHEHAARELAHIDRDGSPIALVVLDIDYFKKVNDEWGHLVGDRVLAHLAEVLPREAAAAAATGRSCSIAKSRVSPPDTDARQRRASRSRNQTSLTVG